MGGRPAWPVSGSVCIVPSGLRRKANLWQREGGAMWSVSITLPVPEGRKGYCGGEAGKACPAEAFPNYPTSSESERRGREKEEGENSLEI